ncbi:MAG: hypothetical protein K2Y04_07005 [Caulobacteraceae bacterium]|nr:hypothetical protein [Caulobacteraceae bacterium]
MLPPLILWAVGALVTGAAAGKGAQVLADRKVSDTEKLQADTNQYLDRRGEEYLAFHERYIGRIITYAAIVRTAVNQVPGVVKSSEIPPEISAFIDRVCAPWGGYFVVKSSGDIFKFSPDDVRAMQSAYASARGLSGGNGATGGAAMAAMWAFTYAKRGITYALDANENHERVVAWAHEARTAIDTQIQDLRTEFDELEREFDTAVTPRLHRALKAPVNLEDLGALAGMADAIEGIALKKQAELAEFMKAASDE